MKRIALLVVAAALASCANTKPPLTVRWVDDSADAKERVWVCGITDESPNELRCMDLERFLLWLQVQQNERNNRIDL